MKSLQGDFDACLSELRRLTAADFAALAWAESTEQTIRWRYASGNRNDRYKRIVLRIGKGIPGKVMRTGRAISLDSYLPEIDKDPWGDAIILAEGLKSVVCVPLTAEGRVMGVLLTGCRYFCHFSKDTLELVCNIAEQLGAMMQIKTSGGNESFELYAKGNAMNGYAE